jgi:hypothetical protein
MGRGVLAPLWQLSELQCRQRRCSGPRSMENFGSSGEPRCSRENSRSSDGELISKKRNVYIYTFISEKRAFDSSSCVRFACITRAYREYRMSRAANANMNIRQTSFGECRATEGETERKRGRGSGVEFGNSNGDNGGTSGVYLRHYSP